MKGWGLVGSFIWDSSVTFRNLVVIAWAVLVAAACRSVISKSHYASLFAEAVTKIDDYSLRRTDERGLYENAMHGMLHSIDKYSDFISGERYKDFEEHMRQEFGGVGVFVGVNPRTRELTVTGTMPNTPAFRAGIHPGDVIVQIDSKDTSGMTDEDAIRAMRGPIGKRVDVTLRRETQEIRKTIRRAAIQIQTVLGESMRSDGSWDYFLPEDPRIAYVNVTDFSEQTASEIRPVLQNIQPQAMALILDLRSNGGGLLPDAVKICDMFLDRRQKIVEIRGRDKSLVEAPYQSTPECLFAPPKPIAVLIDRETASASEIVAACLQDLKRAVIIGEPSFGKGTVQTVIPLERNRSSMKITTATWWSPNGRNVDQNSEISGSPGEHGVHPDEGFGFQFDDSMVFQIKLLRSRRQYKALDIFGNAANGIDGSKPLPSSEETVDDEEPHEGDSKSAKSGEGIPKTTIAEDPVLQRAIEYLQKMIDAESAN